MCAHVKAGKAALVKCKLFNYPDMVYKYSANINGEVLPLMDTNGFTVTFDMFEWWKPEKDTIQMKVVNFNKLVNSTKVRK